VIENTDQDRALKDFVDKSEVEQRKKRLKRAIDLNLKHIYLPKEIQELQEDCFKEYLTDGIKEAKTLREERELMGMTTLKKGY
jgi:ubiquinol-cytochrome c reductase subunit 7